MLLYPCINLLLYEKQRLYMRLKCVIGASNAWRHTFFDSSRLRTAVKNFGGHLRAYNHHCYYRKGL